MVPSDASWMGWVTSGLAACSTPLSLLALTSVLFYYYMTKDYNLWRNLGIPGPTPSFIVGSAMHFKKEPFKTMNQFRKQYGDVWGVFMFRRPILLVSDVDILREVFIKDFENYMDGDKYNPTTTNDEYKDSLLYIKGDKWRRMRRALCSVFSTSKLKYMNASMKRSCGLLVDEILAFAEKGRPIRLDHIFVNFVAEAIVSAGYGVNANNKTFQKNMMDFVRAENATIYLVISRAFPELNPLLRLLGSNRYNPCREAVNFMRQTILSAIEERKRAAANGEECPTDLLQFMLDAETTAEDKTTNSKERWLSPEEIVSQSMVFFLAGSESTLAVLMFTTYLLSLYPDKQEKLHGEVARVLEEFQGELCYEAVSKMSYLENCLWESMRYHPPFPGVKRVGKETRVIKGVTIPAGVRVAVNIAGLSQKEDLFPEPEKFIPERFEDKEKKIPNFVREMSFGIGPRQCVSMRFAMFEMKMAMAALVSKFKFIKTKDTPETLSCSFDVIGCVTDKEPLVGVELRT